jgi:signal transduction histidine kinase
MIWLPIFFDQVQRAVPREKVETGIRAAGLLEVDAPERVLAIIFTNLLRNAMTYTPVRHRRCPDMTAVVSRSRTPAAA